eukprot:5264699-Alexandrium_andersonii.AAC.1
MEGLCGSALGECWGYRPPPQKKHLRRALEALLGVVQGAEAPLGRSGGSREAAANWANILKEDP